MENERLNRDIEEVSTNPEDYEVQTTFEELDVRECEVIEGGDETNETND